MHTTEKLWMITEDVIVMIDLVTLAHYTELVLVQCLGRYTEKYGVYKSLYLLQARLMCGY